MNIAGSSAVDAMASSACEGLAALPLGGQFCGRMEGTVDMSELVASPDAGVFARLRDREFFARAYVEAGAVTWPGELDLAPDAMHPAIKENGRWKPR